MVETIIDKILSNFDLAYMLSVNVLTYLIIKLIDYLNKDKAVSTLVKRLILLGSIIVIGAIYIVSGYSDYIVLINSSISSSVLILL